MTLYGIDISGWQRGINLAAVPSDFVIVKVTGGAGFVSDVCDAQFQSAKKAGRRRGIYHFARESGYQGTAEQEAEHFLKHAAGYLDGHTMVVLDWEGDNTRDVGYAKRWLDYVHQRSGIRPVIYMSSAVANEVDWSVVARAGYALWVAAYVLGYTPIYGYHPPAGLNPVPFWNSPAMWQFTSSGHLPGWGDQLDLNVFFGDGAAWDKYCAKTGALAPAESPTSPEELFTMSQYDEVQRQQGLTHQKLNNITAGLRGFAAAVKGYAIQNQRWHGQSHAKLNMLTNMVTRLSAQQGATFTPEELKQWAKEGAAEALAEKIAEGQIIVDGKEPTP